MLLPKHILGFKLKRNEVAMIVKTNKVRNVLTWIVETNLAYKTFVKSLF